MHKTKLTWAMPLVSFLAACGGSDPAATPGSALSTSDLTGGPFPPASVGPLDRVGAEQRAVDVVGGTVLASEMEEERGLLVWEVVVRRTSGAIVEVDVVERTGQILEIECERPVAGDDLQVQPGFLSLRAAVATATTAVGDATATVLAWELELDDDRDWKWEIELRTSSGDEIEVEIDARTGAVELDDDGRDDWDDARPARPPMGVPAEVEIAAGLIVPGATLVEAEFETEDEGELWDVEMRTTNGAIVELRLLRSGRLVRAEADDQGPVDYDVQPPQLLSLAEALRAAGRDAAELEDWELDREDGGFVWSIDFDDDDVEVDAHTGAVRTDD